MQLMESDTKTKILAHPQLSGMEGQPLSLKLGDKDPCRGDHVLVAALARAAPRRYRACRIGIRTSV